MGFGLFFTHFQVSSVQIMESHVEKKMEHEVETGIYTGFVEAFASSWDSRAP